METVTNHHDNLPQDYPQPKLPVLPILSYSALFGS